MRNVHVNILQKNIDKDEIRFLGKREESIMHIVAYIVDDCNYNCSYCYNKRPRNHEKLNLNLLSTLIESCIDKFECVYVELIGGEPTLHPQLADFCHKFSNLKNILILIYSNGSQRIELLADLLKHQNVHLVLTLHFSICKDYNLIKKTQFLQNSGFAKQIQLRIMLEHGYEKELFNAYENAKSLCSKCDIRLCLINDNILEYNNAFHETILKSHLLDEYAFISKDNMSFEHVTFTDIYSNPSCVNMVSFKKWLCNAGYNYMYVHYNGNIYQCQACFEKNTGIIGNIASFNIDKQLKKHLCMFMNCINCEISIDKRRIFNA